MNAVPVSADARIELDMRTILILVFVTCTAFTSQMAVPLWVGSIIDSFGISAETAGTIAAVEFTTVALASFAVAPRIHQFSVRMLCTVGLGLLIAANGIATLLDSVGPLLVCRATAGLGKGLVISAAFGLAGRSVAPARSFALLNGGYALFSVLTFLVVPFAITASGAAGAFGSLFVATLLGACLLPWVPVGRSDVQQVARPTVNTQTSNIGGFLALLALVLFVAGSAVVWTFIERLGVRIGLTVTEIGMILSGAAAISLIGPALAYALDTRAGYKLPVLLGLGTKIVLAAVLGTVSSVVVFIVAVPLFNLSLLFAVPYLQALMAVADPKGRYAAAAGASMTLGAALGSYLGGVTVTRLGLNHVGTVSVAVLFIVVILALVAIQRLTPATVVNTAGG